MTERDMPLRTPSERLRRELAFNAYLAIDSNDSCYQDHETPPDVLAGANATEGDYTISLDLRMGELVVTPNRSSK